MRRKLLWFLTDKVFRVPQGQVMRKPLLIIRVVLFPVATMGMMASKFVYDWPSDSVVINGKRISRRFLEMMVDDREFVFRKKKGGVFEVVKEEK